jgi:hypothetical protein
MSATFTLGSSPADPTTVTFLMRPLGGTVTTYVYGVNAQVVKDAVGKYHVDAIINASGAWLYRFEGGGTGIGETLEQSFTVAPSAFY